MFYSLVKKECETNAFDLDEDFIHFEFILMEVLLFQALTNLLHSLPVFLKCRIDCYYLLKTIDA